MAWNIDRAHTEIGFAVRHMMLSTVRGRFEKFDAEVAFELASLEEAKVIARVDVASVATGEEKRDMHLRSPEFFDAEKYPTIEFRSGKITRRGKRLELQGQLKIKGAEHTITLKGEIVGPSKDTWGSVRVGFSLSGEMERERWGLGWNQALEAGGVLVAKKVKIVIEAQLIQS